MDKQLTVGIDIGATFTKIGLIDSSGKIKLKTALPTTEYPQKKSLIEAIISVVKDIFADLELKQARQIRGIGIGVPGLIDSDKGIVHYLVNISGWKNVRLSSIFENRFNIATFIDNDVNVMALGELKFGAAEGAQNVICITLGSGVGGAVIIDRKLYRGSSLSAGELGHVTIDMNGPRCNCGGIGCVERYVGNKYIVERAVKGIRNGKKTRLLEYVNADLTPKIIAHASRAGDTFAKEILSETAEYLGIALSSMVNALNPDLIVIGGGVAEAGRSFIKVIRDTILARSMTLPAKTVKVVKAKLGNDAGVIGGSVLVEEKLQNNQ